MATVIWLLLWVVQLVADTQVEAKLNQSVARRAEVREGCVGVHRSASFGAERQAREQDKLETFVCCSAKLRRNTLPWIKVQEL